MTKRAPKGDAPQKPSLARKTIEVDGGATDTETARNAAKVAMSPAAVAARIVFSAEGGGPFSGSLDLPSMVAELRAQGTSANAGDLAHAEAMLMNQATALQSLFMRLTERGLRQTHMPNLEGFMRLALRAQGQCRATLETLATIKNPPVIYAKQANLTTGPQQVNNGTAIPVARTHAAEIESEQSKLLEWQHHGEWMDTRAPSAAFGANPDLATVGEIDRAEDTRGQGDRGAEQLPGCPA